MHSDACSDAIRRNQTQSACTRTHAQTHSDTFRRTCRLVPKIRSSRQSSKSLIAHLMREAISMHSETQSARTRTQSAYTQHAIEGSPRSSYARTDGSAFI